MNHINKWLQKKFGFYFVVPSKYDLINFFKWCAAWPTNICINSCAF